jgi:hypothetical protein
MRRATITLPDKLESRVQAYLDEQEPKPSFTALVQAALEHYLLEYEWTKRSYTPPKGPPKFTVAEPGSGYTDTSIRHDEVLAERE